MTTTVFAKPSVYAPRGGIFPGELGGYGGYCSINSEGDGAYYWSPRNSVERADTLRRYVELGLQGKLHGQYDVASTSTSRALAELSTFEEGAVSNLSELLQATADQVLSSEEISLYHAEHIIATYQYLLRHRAQGVTQEAYQSFVDVIVKECQNRAQELEAIITPGAKYNFRMDDFCRQSNDIEKLIGKMQTASGEDLAIWKSRISIQNDLNLLENKRAEYGDSLTRKAARECYSGAVSVFNNCTRGNYIMGGKIDFSPYSSPLLPAEQDQLQGAFSEFRQEMWRAAHPVKATLRDIYVLALRDDLIETGQFLKRVGRKLGVLPTNDAI